MKKIRLKNGITDYVMFLLYHILAVLLSVTLFFIMSHNVLETNIPFLDNLIAKVKKPKVKEIVYSKIIPSIFKMSGEVKVNGSLAKTGQVLKEGDVIETDSSSFAVINFGGAYVCKVRIEKNSLVKLDELMKANLEEKEEDTQFHLSHGTLLTEMVNLKAAPVKVKIKTNKVAFGIRGTKFTVIDQNNFSFLAVEHGKVATENFITHKTKEVEGGSTYSSDKDGNEKSGPNPGLIKRLNWNLEEDIQKAPDMEEIQAEVNKQEVKSSGPVSHDEALKKIDEEIKLFLTNSEILAKEIEETKKSIDGQVAYLATSLPNVELDIHCLKSSPSKCKLINAELLLKRGFPQTYGSPRLINSIIEDLEKYKKEEEESLVTMRQNVANWEQLLIKRSEVLTWAKAQRALYGQEGEIPASTDEILSKLQDKALEK